MDYQTLKRNIIEQARRDPASFLYAMLGKEGAFDGHAPASSVGYQPTIMHVVDDGDHVSLSVTVWKEAKFLTFEKTAYKAHSVLSENGAISWEFDERTCARGYDYEYNEAERFTDKLILGEAFSEWEDLANSVAAREDSQEYAWFFPVGTNAAFKLSGMMMFASTTETSKKAH